MRSVFLLLAAVLLCVSCTGATKESKVYVIGLISFPLGTNEERSDNLTQEVVDIMESSMQWHVMDVRKQFNVFSGKPQQLVTSIVLDVDLSLNKRVSWVEFLEYKTYGLKEVYIEFVEVKQLCDFGVQFRFEFDDKGDKGEQLYGFITALKGSKKVQDAIQTSPIDYAYKELRVNIGQLEKYRVEQQDVLASLGFSSNEFPFVLEIEKNWVNIELPLELLLPNLDAVKVLNAAGEEIPVSVFASLSYAHKVEKSVTVTVIPDYRDTQNGQEVLERVMELSKDYALVEEGFVTYFGHNGLECERP